MNSNGSRTQKAAKNSLFGLVGKVSTLFISFISRTIFIYLLGRYYLGINGLYTDILNILSFTELGFGSAMTFALYAPVANGERERVRQLLDFYKWTYRFIAFLIAAIGLILTPFLQYIIKGAGSLSLFELRLYFLIFLANTVISYFVTYKYGLLNALQSTYIQTNFETITTVASGLAQIAVLFITHSFLAYLLTNTTIYILSRIAIAFCLNRSYPLLAERPNGPLPKKEKRLILYEVKGLAVHQFASVAVYSTDSIIISAVPTLGVALVGSVSNYNMIINAVSGIITIILNGSIAGFGNLAVSSSKEHFRKVFDEANFVDFWIYGVCTVCLAALLPSFITIWAGSEYLIDPVSFCLIMLNFYIVGQSAIFNNARIAKGNFNMDKWCSLAQAIVNLAISLAGAVTIGLPGIYLGTIVSRMVLFISKPMVTYRFLFGSSPLWYFVDTLKYLAIVVLTSAVCVPLANIILGGAPSLFRWLCVAVACLAASNAIFLVFCGRSPHFAEAKKRALQLIRR